MKKIAIFASGNGSNAENIIHYFKGNQKVSVSLILTNNPHAMVIDRAKKFEIPTIIFSRTEFYSKDKILQKLKDESIDLIVLAGFMWLIPDYLIDYYPRQIINIHPALLPKYGGKGMYGEFVHQAVSNAQETTTGITIHYVNEKYDDGAIIFQKSVNINKCEDPEIIANKIHTLEYQYFPMLIDDVIMGRV